MEVLVFCITISLIMAVMLVGVGICIGKATSDSDEESPKSNSRHVRNGLDNNSILCSRDSECSPSSVGDVHRKVDSRRSVGHLHKVDNEELSNFLRTFMTTCGLLSPGEVDYFKEIITRLDSNGRQK